MIVYFNLLTTKLRTSHENDLPTALPSLSQDSAIENNGDHSVVVIARNNKSPETETRLFYKQ